MSGFLEQSRHRCRGSVTDLAGVDSTTIAVLGGGSVAALAAMVSLTDPERRRKLQAEEVGGGDKEVVREYFNSTGFERWRKIYGETDDRRIYDSAMLRRWRM